MKYSQKLKEILKLKEITQEVLAKDLRVTFASLNRWVNEVSEPREKNKEKIDKIFSFLSGDPDMQSVDIVKDKENTINLCKSVNIKNILNRPDFVKNLVIKMTYASNKLEGSTMTMQEVNEVIYENITFSNRTLVEHIEAKNHETALLHVLSNYKNKIDDKYVCELSKMLMNSIMSDAGKYRNHNVRIAGSFVPTSNYLSIEKRMKEFFVFANTKNKDVIFFLSKMHAEFEMIHPFSDGNGRIGRLLLIHFALQNNMLPTIILPENRREYLNSLQKAQLDNDYRYLEKVIIQSIKNSFELI